MVHLLVRLPVASSSIETVVNEHNRVSVKGGTVWFAIRGRAPSSARCDTLQRQESDGKATYFYLVQRVEQEYRTYRARLFRATTARPQTDEYPAYYRNSSIAEEAALWVNLGHLDISGPKILESLHVESTGTVVAKALKGSMVSVMLVK